MGERTRIPSTNLKEIPSEKGRREKTFKEVTNFVSRLEKTEKYWKTSKTWIQVKFQNTKHKEKIS